MSSTWAARFSSAWLLNQPSFSSWIGWTIGEWPRSWRPVPSARAAERGWTPGPSTMRIFMASLSGGLGFDRTLVEIQHARRQLRVGHGFQVVLELRVELEDLLREQPEDLLAPCPAGVGQVVAVGAVRVAGHVEQAAADEVVDESGGN